LSIATLFIGVSEIAAYFYHISADKIIWKPIEMEP